MNRWVWGVVVIVGMGCSTSHPLDAGRADAPSEAYRFCIDREGAICHRDANASRITVEQFNDECVPSIRPRCESVVGWSECVPTMAARNACILALLDPERFAETTAEVTECSIEALCR